MTAKNKYQKINQEIGEEMKGKLIKKRTDITKLNKTDTLICMRFRPSIHDLMDINKYAPNLRYIILTLQLCLIPHISYSAINALYNTTLTSQTSSINVCLAIFINIYLLGLMSIIFMLSSNTRPNQLMQLS